VSLRVWRSVELSALMAAGLCLQSVAYAQDLSPAAWRVECVGDGKTLDCAALQQLFLKETKQLVAQLSVRLPSGSKAPDPSVSPSAKALESQPPMMTIQLPLGVSLSEPVEIKVDDNELGRYRIDVCTGTGCFVFLTLNDTVLSQLRAGSLFKMSLQDPSKRPIQIQIPMLGFDLAYDKLKR
jgi:invasion protein IalB